jgi:hypothetical protein
MTVAQQLGSLHPDADVLFISDPTNGDQFVTGTPEQLRAFPIPPTAEGHEFSTSFDLYSSLDLEIYEDDDSDAGFTQL